MVTLAPDHGSIVGVAPGAGSSRVSGRTVSVLSVPASTIAPSSPSSAPSGRGIQETDAELIPPCSASDQARHLDSTSPASLKDMKTSCDAGATSWTSLSHRSARLARLPTSAMPIHPRASHPCVRLSDLQKVSRVEAPKFRRQRNLGSSAHGRHSPPSDAGQRGERDHGRRRRLRRRRRVRPPARPTSPTARVWSPIARPSLKCGRRSLEPAATIINHPPTRDTHRSRGHAPDRFTPTPRPPSPPTCR